MGAPIEWQVKILGGAGEELKKVSTGFEATDTGSHKAAEGVKTFESELGNLKQELGGLTVDFSALANGGSLFTFDLAEGLKAVAEVVEKVVDGLTDMAKEIIDIGGETQDLNLAIKLKLGDEGFEGVEEMAQKFAQFTRFSAEETKRAMLPLLDVGVDNKDGLQFDLATIAADAETRSAGRLKFAESLESFASLARKGTISPKQIAGMGIVANDYWKALAAATHNSVAEAKNKAKKGLIDVHTSLKTLVAVAGHRDGGTIGGAALAGGHTLNASLKRLSDLKKNLFSGVADSPGLKSVQKALDAFIKFAAGPIGKGLLDRIAGGIGAIADAALRMLRSAEGQDKIAKAIPEIANGIEKLVGAIPGIIQLFELMGYAGRVISFPFVTADHAIVGVIGSIGSLISRLTNITEPLLSPLVNAAGHFFATGFDLGKSLVLGIVEGIKSLPGRIGEAVKDFGDGVKNRIHEAFEVHSPSRFTHRVGGYFGEGLARGLQASAPGVSDAAARTLAASVMTPSRRAPLAGGDGGGADRIGDAIARALEQATTPPEGAGSQGAGQGGGSIIHAKFIIDGGKQDKREIAEAVIEQLQKLMLGARVSYGVPAPAGE